MAAIRRPRGDRNTTLGRIQTGTRRAAPLVALERRGYDRPVRELPITLQCDCGKLAGVTYGERWSCPDCERTWDTSQIPREEYDRLLRSVRRYRTLTVGPPVALAAVLVPLAIFVGLQYGFLLFVLVMAYGLLVVPQLRKRATQSVLDNTRQWKLHPE